jgi:anti-sigma regulatory factor (Ser/Thr protein kinase)
MDESVHPPDISSAVLLERSRLRIPSRPEWIAPTVEHLKQHARLCGACHESRAGKLVLALHEALTNAVVHGNLELASALKERDDDAFARALAERTADPHYSGRNVIIEVDHDEERCCWSVTDQGRGFDHRHYLEREPDEESLWLSSGRGILLMRAFVDEVRYDQDGRRVTLTLHRDSGIEKRRQPRERMQQRVQVAPIRPDGSVDWQAAYEALSQNLSPDGMGLLQAQLATSDRVLLAIELEGQTLHFPAQVRHCQAVGEGMVELGCRFLLQSEPQPELPGDRPDVEEVVELLLQRRRNLPRASDERRAHPREAYTERIDILIAKGSSPQVGFARDLSRSGIAFICTTAVRLEPIIVCLPQLEGPPLRLKARWFVVSS